MTLEERFMEITKRAEDKEKAVSRLAAEESMLKEDLTEKRDRVSKLLGEKVPLKTGELQKLIDDKEKELSSVLDEMEELV